MSVPAERPDMAGDVEETRTRYVFVEVPGAPSGWPFPLISLDDLEEDA